MDVDKLNPVEVLDDPPVVVPMASPIIGALEVAIAVVTDARPVPVVAPFAPITTGA